MLSREWSQPGSNRRPPACKAGALPTELWPRRRPSVPLASGLDRGANALARCPQRVRTRPPSIPAIADEVVPAMSGCHRTARAFLPHRLMVVLVGKRQHTMPFTQCVDVVAQLHDVLPKRLLPGIERPANSQMEPAKDEQRQEAERDRSSRNEHRCCEEVRRLSRRCLMNHLRFGGCCLLLYRSRSLRNRDLRRNHNLGLLWNDRTLLDHRRHCAQRLLHEFGSAEL